ncbi:MAG: carboxypeptidase-like regulatory domain-containing protein [Planctomycetota bacterium]
MNSPRTLVFAILAILLAVILGWTLWGGGSAPPEPGPIEPPETNSTDVGTAAVETTPTKTTATTPPPRTQIDVAADSKSDLDPSVLAALCGFTGRLVDQDRQPIADAAIKLFRIGAEDFLAQNIDLFAAESTIQPDLVAGRAESGDDGRFTIRGVFPFAVYVLHSGVGSDYSTWQVIERAAGPGELVDLGDIVMKRCGTLIGKVVDEDGSGIPGVLVRAVDLPGTALSFVPFERFDPKGAILIDQEKFAITMPSWLEQRMEDLPIPHTLTGSDGSFRLQGVVPGGNLVAATRSRFVPHVRQRVVVEAGKEEDLGELVLREGESAVGTVVDMQDQPIAGAEVLVAPCSLAVPVHFSGPSARTAEDGAFEISGMASGDVAAAARRSARDPWVVIPRQSVGKDIKIVLPSAANLTIVPRDQRGEVVSGVRLRLHAGDDNEFIMASLFGMGAALDLRDRVEVGKDGELVVRDLPHGPYMLLADSPAHSLVSHRVRLEGDQRIELQFLPRTNFEVTVLTPEGTPARGSQLFAVRRGKTNLDIPMLVGTVDEEGKLIVDSLGSDSVRLTAKHPAYGLCALHTGLPASEPIVLRFQRPGAVVGVITDGGKAPLPGKFMLYLEPRGMDGAVPQIPLITAPDLEGRFRFGAVRPGRYRVGAFHALSSIGSAGGVMELVRQSMMDDQFPRQNIEVAEGATVEVALDPQRAAPVEGPVVRLSGRVTIDGRPAAGYAVSFWSNGQRGRTVLDATGQFVFPQVKTGNMQLDIRTPPPTDLFASRRSSERIHEESILLEEGKDRDLSIDLVLASVSGFVRAPDGTPAPECDVNVQITRARNEREQSTTWQHARTDASGAFRFESISAGKLRITANQHPNAISLPVEVEMKPGEDIFGVELQLRRTVKISGQLDLAVFGTPKPDNIYVMLENKAGQQGETQSWADVEDDGRFTAEGIPDGRYRARISIRRERNWEQWSDDQELIVAGADVTGVVLRPVKQQN